MNSSESANQQTAHGSPLTTRKSGNCECIAAWGRQSHVSY